MQAVTFTKDENKAIRDAFAAIRYICETTNWSDAPEFRTAYKLSRKDSDSIEEAEGRIVKAWIAGARAIDADCSIANYPWGYTESYQRAFRLGAQQALKHSGPNRSDYTGPLYDTARQLCPNAITTFDAAMQRWHDIPVSERMESE